MTVSPMNRRGLQYFAVIADMVKSRALPAGQRALVQKHTQGRDLGFLGEPRVNVLELNLELNSQPGH